MYFSKWGNFPAMEDRINIYNIFIGLISTQSPGRITSLFNSEAHFVGRRHGSSKLKISDDRLSRRCWNVVSAGHGENRRPFAFGLEQLTCFGVCIPPSPFFPALHCSWPRLIFLFTPLSVSQLNRSNMPLSCGFVYSGSDPRPVGDEQHCSSFSPH